MRRSIRRLVLAILVLLILLGWLAWPWLKAIPHKLQPLRDYVVYDAEKPSRTGRRPTVWRQPVSRTELLIARVYHNQRPPRPRPPPVKPTPPAIAILPDDHLDDFVVEHPKWFARPQSWDELDMANDMGKAQRAASFFAVRYNLEKPFLGEIPTSLCCQNGRDRELKTPEKPEVFVVVASNRAEAAQMAAYERRPRVMYPAEQYWAVVYVGRSHSSPPAFLIDRVDIGKTLTDILIAQPKPGPVTRDIVPYWFFVPLGRLPDGPYQVHVRHATTTTPSFSTTVNLRRATKTEIKQYNEANEKG